MRLKYNLNFYLIYGIFFNLYVFNFEIHLDEKFTGINYQENIQNKQLLYI